MTDYQEIENKARRLSAETQQEMVRHMARAVGRVFGYRGAGRSR